MTVRVLLEAPKGPIIRVRRPASVLNRIRWLLLFVGLAAVAYAGYAYLDAQVYQAYEDWSFDREIAGQTPSVVGFLREQVRLKPVADHRGPDTLPGDSVQADRTNTETVRDEQTGESGFSARQRRDDQMIGRIAIPRLSVRAIVREGVDDKTLRRAVGHVPETARPGTNGNVGLAGHRDSFFRNLRDVKKEDRIVFETLDGKYEYVVESMKIVRPQDVQVLAPTQEPVLTLVTCYPFNYVGNAPKRFIVRARQVSAEPVRAAAETAGIQKALD